MNEKEESRTKKGTMSDQTLKKVEVVEVRLMKAMATTITIALASCSRRSLRNRTTFGSALIITGLPARIMVTLISARSTYKSPNSIQYYKRKRQYTLKWILLDCYP